MQKPEVMAVHKNDVHAVYIWNGDGINMLEDNVSVQHYERKTLIEKESDMVLISTDGSNCIVNVRSSNLDWLKAYVKETFPHLIESGHPVVDGELFDTWHVFLDEEGANAINNFPKSDTVVVLGGSK